MDFSQHIENRAWAFEALDQLQAFLNDEDFEGSAPEETSLLERKRKELIDGKYRVVFLGSFNVGKSALINAFLGDEYLPTVLEECTTKITHVHYGEAMVAVLNLSCQSSRQDLEALRSVLEAAGIDADVSEGETSCEIAVTFATCNPRDLLRTLRALTTMSADEDFPQLRDLRQKFDEVFVHLPNTCLPEDVALVDSPGVHSISQTNAKIANEIIPHSHVVVCLIDSQSAGAEQNQEFVEQIVSHRHRKLFFVINKSDQLNHEEIDPTGKRGPARDLFRSIEGVVQRPETFFVSSLYALVGAQLAAGKIQLEDIDANRKIKIPMAVQREMIQEGEPTQRLASHLLEQSNIDPFKSRLLQYLYHENREGAILESICRFLESKAWGFARPLEIKLEMAKDVPRLDELDRMHAALSEQLADLRIRADKVTASYGVMSGGGEYEGESYPGYESVLDRFMSEVEIEKNVMMPVRQWLGDNKNVKRASRHKYAAVREKLEVAIDSYLAEIHEQVNSLVEQVEQSTLAEISDGRCEIPVDPPVAVQRAQVGPMRVSLAASYVGSAFLGIVVGGSIGLALAMAKVSPPLPEMAQLPPQLAAAAGTVLTLTAPYFTPAMMVNAAIGKLIGLVLGLTLRSATATTVRRSRLLTLCGQRARGLLARTEEKTKLSPVLDRFKSALNSRRDQFGEAVRSVFVKRIANLTREIGQIQEEADALREKQRQIIARIEPKLETLGAMRRRALDIADANAPKTDL